MSNNEPDDQSTADSQQGSEQQPADSDQPTAQAQEQPADQTNQSAEQPEEQPTETDQSADQAEEQPVDTGQATERPEEQPTAETDQTAGESHQVAEAEGQQTDKGDSSATVATDDTPEVAGGDASPDGGGEATVQPAKGGSTRLAPRKRLFRFVNSTDNWAIPDFIKNVFSPDPTDYFFDFALAGAADGNPARMMEDGWERVPVDGIMDFPFNTIERAHFFIGVALIPNSKVDPKQSTSQPLQRIGSMHTDDFAAMKATDAPTLVKKFPDGVFVLEIKLVAFYIQIVDAGATTYEGELSKAKIPLEDVVYNALSPYTDPSGKVIGTKHDVVYWSTDLHLNGRKYVP